MRRPAWYWHESRRLDVKMTPMIDVVFLLLIFFVCTANFRVPEEILPTQLLGPSSSAQAEDTDPELDDLERVVIRVGWRDGEPTWRINERTCRHLGEVREVLVALAAIRKDLPVILDVNGEVPLGSVIDLYDLCRLIGLDQVQFAASVEV